MHVCVCVCVAPFYALTTIIGARRKVAHQVFRRSSFTGGISVVPNVSDKRRLNLATEVFSCQGRDLCGEDATGDVPATPTPPIRRAATVGRRCGKAAN